MDYDCLIIGGGPAGLAAATYLGRFCRKIVLVDAGNSRARAIPESHNYPGFEDGISGPKLLNILHQQARQYGAEIVSGKVISLARNGAGFRASVDGRRIDAARILMATGLKDKAPNMPGLREAVAHTSVRYCPVCDAYEAMDKNIAVFGSLEDAEPKAIFLRTYSRSVTVLPIDVCKMDAKAIARLKQAGIACAPSAVADFRPVSAGIEVELTTGAHLYFDVVYPTLGCEVHSELAASLGARCNEVGCLVVDDKQHTTAAGIFAAGDVVSDLHQIAVAAGHAGIAATAIHRSLPPNFRA